ncbi:MAG: rod shape-determining protein [Elusimicrobiota bacterium]|nr:rod shape-determining protein [Elusimicrobiota bacterium]MDH5661609.1 rod shape-determining protein [Elusimicrobiota bacterium]
MFNFLLGLFSNDMGIDLGTSTTLVYVKGQGIVLWEPSVVAINQDTGDILAVGTEAKKMIGKTPANITAFRPMRDGVIADFEVTEKMIRHFIKKVHNRRSLLHPRIVIGVPSCITEVERRAVRDASEQAGAREIHLIDEPMAAAIGAEVPVQDPAGNMIVDIGGGTTEVAVISLGGMVLSRSVRVAGDEVDEAIISYFKKERNLLIGERTAEETKIRIGSAMPEKEEKTIEVKGRDLATGLPKTVRVSSGEMHEAVKGPIRIIVGLIKDTLEDTPAELSADLVDRGIILVGGGALLSGLPELLSRETELPVNLAPDPLTCVVLGAGTYLEELEKLKHRK